MSVAVFLLPLGTLLIGFRAGAIGTWLGVIDRPDDHRKTHGTPTPLVGGLAIMAPFLLVCAQRLWGSPDRAVEGAVGGAVEGALMIGVGGAFLLGFLDDRKPMSARFRLLGGAGLVLVSVGIMPALLVDRLDFSFLREALALNSFAIVFTVLVATGMMHAVNMADGMNGLVCGLCLIWSLFLFFFASPQIASILGILIVCTFVTLVFNLRGKLFLGNSGAYALALTVSILTIHTYNTTNGLLRADVVVAWFIVPVLDCLRLMAARWREGRSPMSADTNHLHHRLQRILPKGCVVFTYWLLVGVPGALAIAKPSLAPLAVLGVLGIYLGLLVWTSERTAAGKGKTQVSH